MCFYSLNGLKYQDLCTVGEKKGKSRIPKFQAEDKRMDLPPFLLIICFLKLPQNMNTNYLYKMVIADREGEASWLHWCWTLSDVCKEIHKMHRFGYRRAYIPSEGNSIRQQSATVFWQQDGKSRLESETLALRPNHCHCFSLWCGTGKLLVRTVWTKPWLPSAAEVPVLHARSDGSINWILLTGRWLPTPENKAIVFQLSCKT